MATVTRSGGAHDDADDDLHQTSPDGGNLDGADDDDDDEFVSHDEPGAALPLPLLAGVVLTCPLCNPRLPLPAAGLLEHLLVAHHVTVSEVDQLVDLQVCVLVFARGVT
jgi:hypothetical protein